MIFAGSDYLEELSKWMDIKVLPPCINPNGTGETAVGMPKEMDCGVIPDHIGPAGIGYNPTGSGISQARTCGPSVEKTLASQETASLSSTEDDNFSDSEGDEANANNLNVSMGALHVA